MCTVFSVCWDSHLTAALLRTFSCNSLLSPWALKPCCPCGSFLAFIVLASLHGVLRLAVRSWRASSLNLRRDLLPVAFSLVGSRDNSPSRLVVIPRVPFSPRRDASSSSSLLVGIHRARLLSLLRFLVFASSHHDSSCSPLRASYESRGSWCL